MYFIKRNLKYLAITVFICWLIVNLFLKTAYGESIISDATVEVIQEGTSVIIENSAKPDQLPKTNEQLSGLFTWIGIVLIIFWVKSLRDKFRT
ncbi:LPXTG cell wall anchor domain-containing protein [Enterococcus ureasiticus]|uniref:Uncharacterized protein n=1 Tax=Enterococcus ureasiticus TaxID=903984 RepID=A0A1E5GA17_9ENTE|nr:LPXTG cell wall anchor domain-containing protein [Enterococcus ureasiticus]OEG09552.1 hypothetical protein BCR21_14480 [Enterococcus ureasiticus]